jgi:hypothetical protein
MEMLICRVCHNTMPIHFFSRDRNRSYRNCRANICKACDAAKFRAWYLNNRDRILEKAKTRDRRKKKYVLIVDGVAHDITSKVGDKSNLRIFFELTDD